MDLLSRSQQAGLNKSELNSLKVITSQLHRTAFLTGPELAKECSVSPSAITRLSQKLGYEGFPEMKKDLEEMYRKTITPYEAFESFLAQPDKSSVASQSIGQDFKNLQRLLGQLDENHLKQTIQLLNGAEKIYLMGIASSESLVDLAAAYLETLGKRCIRLKGFGISKQAELLEIDRKDVAIAFSFQRILKEVRDSVLFFGKSGCRTIAITDSALNPLAMSTDLTLIAPVNGTTFGLSLAAPVAMINLISNALASLDSKRSLHQLKKAKEIWESRPIFCE